jgi:hypothetical protein
MVMTAFATVGSVYEVEAWPFVFVTAGFGENVPPAPPSLNVTEAPDTTFPEEFFAVTTIASGRVVPTVPVCLPPEESTNVVTELDVEVSVKIAEV